MIPNTKINELTGTTERLPTPSLMPDQRSQILTMCQGAGRNQHVLHEGREYWVEGLDDPPTDLWCVAWRESGFVSADPV